MSIENIKTQSLRDTSEGFHNEKEFYLSHLEQAHNSRELLSSLKQFENSIEWPLDMADQNLHINGWFGVPHLVSPEDTSYLHFGVDVQAGPGTPVFAPSDCILQSLYLASESDGRLHEGQAEVRLISKSLGIMFTFAHLDEKSIPKFLLEDRNKSQVVRSTISPGTMIGRVGKWPDLLPESTQIQEDIQNVYGRAYDHLHIGVNHSEGFFRGLVFEDGQKIDPLLLFRRIY